MMFPWFLLVLRLKHGGLWKKAAVGKWEGYRGISVPPGWRKMHSTHSWGSCKDECWLFCEMLLPYSLGDLLPSLGWTLSAPWLAGSQGRCSTLDQVLTLVTRGRRCGWRAPGVGAVPTANRSLLALEEPRVSTGTCKQQTRSSPGAPAA